MTVVTQLKLASLVGAKSSWMVRIGGKVVAFFMPSFFLGVFF
jgi:hypothetical protein